jgi:Fur family ferric uptake transcriptional regulator
MNLINEEHKRLRKKGYRITPAKRALIDLFSVNDKPLAVPEIKLLLANNNLKPDKATLYRDIEFLMKEKLITEVELGDGKKRYESARLEHHHHLVCQNCSAIEDVIPGPELETAIEKISGEKSFKIKSHILEFFGLCKNCV